MRSNHKKLVIILPRNTHHVWNNEKIGYPPAHREVVLGYQDVEKVLLSFTFDVRESPGAHLDPDRPIMINGRSVQIPDLPQSERSLTYVEISDVDVTKAVKTGQTGQKNLVEVNYAVPPISRFKPFLQGKVGELTLYFTVVLPEAKPAPAPAPQSLTKFCWYCGKSIPSDSRVCPYCANRLEIIDDNPKKCRNCENALPRISKFCDKCGSEQPAT